MGKRSKHSKKRNNGFAKLMVLVLIVFAIVSIVVINNNNNNNNGNDIVQTSKEIKNNNNGDDKVAPEITLDEDKTVVAKGEKYKIKATAKDDIDGDLTSKIEVSELDTSKEGEYTVTLSVKDNAGNKAEKTQKVIVRKELEDGLPVLMYHFFYDDNKYYKKDSNWLKISDFEDQLKYMSENNYNFPTWEEVNDFIDGKYKLPTKSVVLTVDDGDDSFFDLAVPLLQKYKIPATSFVVTSWYGHRYDPNMKYVVWESHSDQMHQSGENGKGRMVNWSKSEIVSDLKESSRILGGADVFCYPFGHYNDTAIAALKEADYKLAFTVEGGRVSKSDNKYTLPRVRVGDGNSLSYFIECIE